MESEEKLCIKVLRTLQQMLLKKAKYGDRVSVPQGPGTWGPWAWALCPLGTPFLSCIHPPGQPAAQDATPELPTEPQVQLKG